MKYSIFFLVFFFTSLFGKTDVTGDWCAILDLEIMKLTLNLHVNEDETASLICVEQEETMPIDAITYDGTSFSFDIPEYKISYSGKIQGEEIKGTFTQGRPFSLDWKRGQLAAKVIKRPQLEAIDSTLYLTEEVTVQNGEITLAGTFVLPKVKGLFPAVIFVSGSGPHDRDETILNHKPFLVIADHLAKDGIASLRLDKRGCAKSTGIYETSTLHDFASDMLAAKHYLQTREEVSSIGVLGHSEGGIIAPIVAAQSEDISFMITLAGTGALGEEVWLHQQKLILENDGASPEEIANYLKNLKTIVSVIKTEPNIEKAKILLEERLEADPETTTSFIDFSNNAWCRSFVTTDPCPYLEKVKCPTLALFGSLDLQVDPAQNLPGIEKALKNNPDVTIKVIPGLNHLFQTATTGSPNEYFTIEETISPEVLDILSSWILEKS